MTVGLGEELVSKYAELSEAVLLPCRHALDDVHTGLDTMCALGGRCHLLFVILPLGSIDKLNGVACLLLDNPQPTRTSPGRRPLCHEPPAALDLLVGRARRHGGRIALQGRAPVRGFLLYGSNLVVCSQAGSNNTSLPCALGHCRKQLAALSIGSVVVSGLCYAGMLATRGQMLRPRNAS